MNKVMVSLFKIKPVEERNTLDIENDRLWIPKVSDLNDPYDCAAFPYLGTVFELEELDVLANKLVNESCLFRDIFSAEYYETKDKSERNDYVHRFICEEIRNIGVCSFLDSPYNLVTWSHYGNNHMGMCLEYERPDNWLESMARGYIFEGVSYVNLAPWYEWKDFMNAPSLGMRLCLTSKYKDWAYENETRLITYEHHGGCTIPLSTLKLKLKRIYLGCKIKTTPELERLENICDEKQIEIIRLQKLEHSYRLSSA